MKSLPIFDCRLKEWRNSNTSTEEDDMETTTLFNRNLAIGNRQ